MGVFAFISKQGAVEKFACLQVQPVDRDCILLTTIQQFLIVDSGCTFGSFLLYDLVLMRFGA